MAYILPLVNWGNGIIMIGVFASSGHCLGRGPVDLYE